MASHKHRLLVPDCDDVFRWLDENAGTSVVRKIGYLSLFGWTMKIVLDDPEVSEKFAKDWAMYEYDRIYAGRKQALEEVSNLPKGEERDKAMKGWRNWVQAK